MQRNRYQHDSETSDIAYDMFNMNDYGDTNNFKGNDKFQIKNRFGMSRMNSAEKDTPMDNRYDDNDQKSPQKTNMSRITVIFLITLGAVAGFVNGLIILGNNGLAYAQAIIISSFDDNYAAGLFLFMFTTSVFVYLAAYLCKYVSNRAAGSGLPELKALLSGDLKNEQESKNLVSSRALFAKIFGLILALGSCLSIGSEGPLVHTASCLAYFLMRHIYEFEPLLNSPTYLRQVNPRWTQLT